MECICPETNKGHSKSCPCRSQKRQCPFCSRLSFWPVGKAKAEARCAKCKLDLADYAAKVRFRRLPSEDRFLR